ncbi:alpha/beta hydrolase [Aerolutibacter ruishenii]|uniref:Alpha/beta fold hydrolase n=1 Tax=Aerolutibacter ruishenii TaxID=686800 RepID=A0A562LIA4_9GAMM|nr:alpha/beta fold hydrolase [Lysobacter ruishenii]TWI07333.1 hypothetical protein IP93_02687 [Lysobacter ruishenii]
MSRTSSLLLPALLALLGAGAPQPGLAGPSPAAAAPVAAAPDQGAVALAIKLLDHLDAGRFAEAESLFSPEMRAAVPADKLQQVWVSLSQNMGAPGPRGVPTTIAHGDMTVVSVPLPYAKANLAARITSDASGRIAGFLIQPGPPPVAAPVPSTSHVEREISVGSGERALPATLTLPTAASAAAPVPAVVLVHGSGPQDRDETMGPNRPFLDIAHGLAARGIAVLRYEKRTRVRPQDLAGIDFNVDDEVTRDAVAAIASVRAVEGVDRGRVFVLGHSLGGMLAPRIASQSGQVAGVVLMAAPARPVLDLMLEQSHRLAAGDGTVSETEQQALDDLGARVKRVRGAGEVAAADSPMGLPVSYWRSLESIDPVADALALRRPTLVVHGGRDIQVVDADWQRWRDQLSELRNVRLRHYPALNHLGIAGKGPGTVEEYLTAGHVDAQLIDDIAGWIRQR